MRRLDRFILKAFIGPFVAILAIVIFILVMQFLWLYIDELVGKGLELIEGRQGTTRLVVEERGVVPACGKVARAAFGIGLGIPPGETVNLRMLL